MKNLTQSLTILGLLAASTLTLSAQKLHPELQHAMANLHEANKQLLAIHKSSATADIDSANKEIVAAYDELRAAATDDDKKMAETFPPENESGNTGLLHKVRHLLEVAHKETAEQEDDVKAQSAQQDALKHIDEATKHLDAAIAAPGKATTGDASSDKTSPASMPSAKNPNAGKSILGSDSTSSMPSAKNPDAGKTILGSDSSKGSKSGSLIQQHPAYLHALSDLREARGWLSNDKRGGLNKEEQEAISEIDRTIQDIHKASLDDGKDLNDHPPIDAKLDHKGALHHALELTGKAKDDISMHETNSFAQNLRQRALDHLKAINEHLTAALNVTEGK